MSPPQPPRARRLPHAVNSHGVTRNDDWHWLRDREDPEVIAYLEAENVYTDAVMAPTLGLQQELFEGIRARVRETDASAPVRSGGWWYYTRTEEGQQYPIMCRRPDPERRLEAAAVASEARDGLPPDEVVILDENVLAGGDYLALGVFDISPDHSVLAYATDLDGSEVYTLRFRSLDSLEDLPDTIEGVYYGSAWSARGQVFYYVKPDEAMRPYQVWRHLLGTEADHDVLVYQEDDERFFVSVYLSRSRRRIVIDSDSKTSSEVRWLDADAVDAGESTVLLARQPGVEHRAEHDGDGWLILTNQPGPGGRPATNFELHRLDDSGDQRVILAHRDDVKLEHVDAFASFVAVGERSCTDGLERLRILGRDGSQDIVPQPESVYSLLGGENPEWDQDTYRFGYTSLVTPRTAVDYRVTDESRQVVWSQSVPGYDPTRYETQRLWATAPDGAQVPISVLARRDLRRDGTAPGLLYGYGAYEMSVDPTFSVAALNLVERGTVYAIAHVRGGGELGRRWYEQGRMEHKVNTFTDFVAAAETLIAQGWVHRDRLAARGGSAGGLLMGAVVNLRPDLWRAVVAEVPFVDVVTTMSDTTLPLTVTEWEEWGDPLHDPEALARMLGYSPYDNVAPRATYPAIYATAGLNDPRVGFWEPAKWVARLRSVGAGGPDRPILLRTELGAGHGGPSGRYDIWRDEARVQAFILSQTGSS